MKPLAQPRRSTGKPLRQRRHLKTRRRWTWRSLFQPPIPQLAVLAVVLAGLYALATSAVFAISTVQVVGGNALPVTLLRQSCGCLGTNIFLTQPEAIRRRLNRIAWVDVRQVYARLPDRIVIDASYRQPVALWRTSVATYTVDMAGMVLYDVQSPPVPPAMVPVSTTVPIIYNAHDTTFAAGQYISSRAVAMVLWTRKELAPDIASKVDRYRWSPYSGLTAHSRKGWWFALGFHLGDDLQIRLDALDAAYKAGIMDRHHCNFVDLEPMPKIYCNYQLQWHGSWGPGSR